MAVNKRKQTASGQLVLRQRAEGICPASGWRSRRFVGRSADTEAPIEAPAADGNESPGSREQSPVVAAPRFGLLDQLIQGGSTLPHRNSRAAGRGVWRRKRVDARNNRTLAGPVWRSDRKARQAGYSVRPGRASLPSRSPARSAPALIGHGDQLLTMSAPVHEPSHAEERPPDLAERLVAISADRNLTAATRPRARSRLRALPILVDPDAQ